MSRRDWRLHAPPVFWTGEGEIKIRVANAVVALDDWTARGRYQAEYVARAETVRAWLATQIPPSTPARRLLEAQRAILERALGAHAALLAP